MDEQISASYGIDSEYAIISKTKYDVLEIIYKNISKLREEEEYSAIITEE